MHTAQFKKNYVLIVQNERGSEWSEGDFGYLTSTTADAQDTLDWISAQEWSNGKVGLHGCYSAENKLKLGAIGHPALCACVPMSSGAWHRRLAGAEGSTAVLPRRRSHDQDVGAVVCAIRDPAAPEAARERRGRRTRPHLRRYSVRVPDFRDPDYAAALDEATGKRRAVKCCDAWVRR